MEELLAALYFERKYAWDACLDINPAYSSESEAEHGQVSSLENICRDFIGSRQSLVDRAVHCLPKRLIVTLLLAAVKSRSGDNSLSIHTLLHHWPEERLSLRDLGVHVPFQDALDRRAVGEEYARVAENVARGFFHALEARAPLRLRCLDLRGFPLVGPAVNILASQCMLAYCEFQRAQVLDLVRSAQDTGKLHWSSVRGFGELAPDTRLPAQIYDIHFDVILRNDEPVGEGELAEGEDPAPTASSPSFVTLFKALKAVQLLRTQYEAASSSDPPGPVLKLHLGSLQAEDFDAKTLCLLLDLLPDDELLGLSLQRLYAEDAVHLLALSHSVQRFKQLASLRMWVSSLDLRAPSQLSLGSDEFFILRELLRALPDLRRFGLGATLPVQGGVLRRLVSDIRCPLELLDASGLEGTSPVDLMWLSTAAGLAALRHLDLGGHGALLRSQLSTLACLLKHARHSLEVLLLRDAGLSDSQLDRVLQNVLLMDNIRLVDISGSTWTHEASFVHMLTKLAAHPTLVQIAVGGIHWPEVAEGQPVDFTSLNAWRHRCLDIVSAIVVKEKEPLRREPLRVTIRWPHQ